MKYRVIKTNDIREGLSLEQKNALLDITNSILSYRESLGKKRNFYLVANIDEPYAAEIYKIMHKHGHTPCSDCECPSTALCDHDCVWFPLRKDF